MSAAADRLARLVSTVPPRLVDFSDSEAASPRAPGRWSRKEILGHLIDSASNNHQRVVRLELADSLDFPSYQQEDWVRAQNYAAEPWPDIVNLWLLLNRHLLHVLRNLDPSALEHLCRLGDGQPLTLSTLIDSYVDHVEHHLEQILAP